MFCILKMYHIKEVTNFLFSKWQKFSFLSLSLCEFWFQFAWVDASAWLQENPMLLGQVHESTSCISLCLLRSRFLAEGPQWVNLPCTPWLMWAKSRRSCRFSRVIQHGALKKKKKFYVRIVAGTWGLRGWRLFFSGCRVSVLQNW